MKKMKTILVPILTMGIWLYFFLGFSGSMLLISLACAMELLVFPLLLGNDSAGETSANSRGIAIIILFVLYDFIMNIFLPLGVVKIANSLLVVLIIHIVYVVVITILLQKDSVTNRAIYCAAYEIFLITLLYGNISMLCDFGKAGVFLGFLISLLLIPLNAIIYKLFDKAESEA